MGTCRLFSCLPPHLNLLFCRSITPAHIRVLPSQQLLLTGFQHARLGLVPVPSDSPRDYLPLDILLGNAYVTMAADVWACGTVYLHLLAGVSSWIGCHARGLRLMWLCTCSAPCFARTATLRRLC